MKNIIKTAGIISLSIATLASCKKDEKNAAPGSVELGFHNIVGAQDLDMNGKWYLNANNDSFQVTKFNYYISNIHLNTADGSSFAEPESYHLIQASDEASLTQNITNVAAGTYTSITFMIGVDSLHNVSGAQTGALDPLNGMFWSWNTGYIMAKFEGISPQSTQTDHSLTFHIGGFAGAENTIRTVTLTLPQPITINNNAYHLQINADVAKWFAAPNIIDFSATNSLMMPGSMAMKIADNYANMFSLEQAIIIK